MSLWSEMNTTAKQLLVILSIASLLVGVVVDRFTVVEVRAREQQKAADELAGAQEAIESIKLDITATKAATAASINGIAQQVEGSAQANRETARQVTAIATQVNRVTAQVASFANTNSRLRAIEAQLKIIPEVRSELEELKRTTTKLRKKVER